MAAFQLAVMPVALVLTDNRSPANPPVILTVAPEIGSEWLT